jgi:hypothetical protein
MLFYKCFHNSCSNRTWADAKAKIGPPPRQSKPATALVPPRPQGRDLEQKDTNAFSLEEQLRSKVGQALKTSNLTEAEIAKVLEILKGFPRNKSLTDEVTEWIMTSNGKFLTSDIHRELNVTSRDLKKQVNEVCRRLVERGKLTPCGDKRGCYRVIEESEEIDWLSADIGNIYRVRWPFALEKYVKIFPGNIVVIAGEKESGKSAFLYNFIKMNQDSQRIRYFNSESSREELKLRLSDHEDIRVQDWNFKAYRRSRDFADAIFPNDLNIVDYFEITDNFYQIGGEIRKIHDRLKKGICIIALQMDTGAKVGRGGDFSREKSRMYLTMGGGKLKIVDAKIWANRDINPHGKVFDYKLIGGWKFLEME